MTETKNSPQTNERSIAPASPPEHLRWLKWARLYAVVCSLLIVGSQFFENELWLFFLVPYLTATALLWTQWPGLRTNFIVAWAVIAISASFMATVEARSGWVALFWLILLLANVFLILATVKSQPPKAATVPRPSPLPQNHPKLWALRGAALFSILVLGWPLFDGSRSFSGPYSGTSIPPIALVPALLPYVIVLLHSFLTRQGEKLHPTLGLAISWAVLGGLIFPLWALNVRSGLSFVAALVLGHLAVIITAGLCIPLVREYSTVPSSVGTGVAVSIVLFLLGAMVIAPNLRPPASGEASAKRSIRLLVNCAVSYQANHPETGFPATVSGMGPYSRGGDGCIDSVLLDAAAPEGKPKSGYNFTYTPGEPNEEGVIETFTLTAVPSRCRRTGVRTFFADQTGVLRFTDNQRNNCPVADANSPPLS